MGMDDGAGRYARRQTFHDVGAKKGRALRRRAVSEAEPKRGERMGDGRESVIRCARRGGCGNVRGGGGAQRGTDGTETGQKYESEGTVPGSPQRISPRWKDRSSLQDRGSAAFALDDGGLISARLHSPKSGGPRQFGCFSTIAATCRVSGGFLSLGVRRRSGATHSSRHRSTAHSTPTTRIEDKCQMPGTTTKRADGRCTSSRSGSSAASP